MISDVEEYGDHHLHQIVAQIESTSTPKGWAVNEGFPVSPTNRFRQRLSKKQHKDTTQNIPRRMLFHYLKSTWKKMTPHITRLLIASRPSVEENPHIVRLGITIFERVPSPPTVTDACQIRKQGSASNPIPPDQLHRSATATRKRDVREVQQPT